MSAVLSGRVVDERDRLGACEEVQLAGGRARRPRRARRRERGCRGRGGADGVIVVMVTIAGRFMASPSGQR